MFYVLHFVRLLGRLDTTSVEIMKSWITGVSSTCLLPSLKRAWVSFLQCVQPSGWGLILNPGSPYHGLDVVIIHSSLTLCFQFTLIFLSGKRTIHFGPWFSHFWACLDIIKPGLKSTTSCSGSLIREQSYFDCNQRESQHRVIISNWT